MRKKRNLLVIYLLAAAIFTASLLAGCQTFFPEPTPTPTQTHRPTRTPTPTATSTPTSTPTITLLSTNTPQPSETPIPSATRLPTNTPTATEQTFVREGTDVPEPVEPITAENAGQVVELSRMGKGAIQDVQLSPDGKILLVLTSIGIYGYQAEDQVEVWRYEDPVGLVTMVVPGSARWVAAAAGDGRIVMLDYERGKLLDERITLYSEITDLAYSPDDELLAGIGDLGLTVWDVGNGEPLYKYPGIEGELVRFTPDGESLIVSEPENTRFYSLADGEELKTISTGDYWPIDFSADGSYFTNGKTVWDGITGEQVFKTDMDSPYAEFGFVAFSPDNQYMALFVVDDDHISIWSISDGEEVRELYSQYNQVVGSSIPVAKEGAPALVSGGWFSYYYDLAFSPDGSKLAAPTSDFVTEVWDLADSTLKKRIPSFGSGVIYSTNSLIVVYGQGSLEQLNPITGSRIHAERDFTQLRDEQGHILDGFSERQILFSLDGKYLFTENIVWQIPESRRVFQIENETVLAISPEGDFFYTFDNVTDTVYVRRIFGFSAAAVIKLTPPETEISGVDLSGGDYFIEVPIIAPTGLYFSGHISISDIPNLYTWDLETGSVVDELYANTWRGYYDPTGRFLITGRSDGLYVVNLETFEQVFVWQGDFSEIEKNIFFSPDGQYLFVVQDKIRKFEIVEDGLLELVDSFPFEFDGVSLVDDLAISPNNEVFALASEGTVYLYDFNTGELLAEIPAHMDKIAAMAFSPDGSYLATSSYDGTVKLWGIP